MVEGIAAGQKHVNPIDEQRNDLLGQVGFKREELFALAAEAAHFCAASDESLVLLRAQSTAKLDSADWRAWRCFVHNLWAKGCVHLWSQK